MSDHELDRDSELSADEERALSAVLTAPELDAAGWESLCARVSAAGELPLARRRRARHAGRARAWRWLKPALPLAAAALLLVLLSSPLRNGHGPGDAAGTAELNAAERALIADVSDAEFTRLVSGAADAEALLRLAVER